MNGTKDDEHGAGYEGPNKLSYCKTKPNKLRHPEIEINKVGKIKPN